MDQLSCRVEHREDATIVQVRGEVDLTGSSRLREVLVKVLARDPSGHLVVDLSAVDFMDSTGIGVLVGARKRATVHGGRFTVVVNTTSVRRVLEITGLLQAWRVTASVEEALQD